jgi:hypothetical protein
MLPKISKTPVPFLLLRGLRVQEDCADHRATVSELGLTRPAPAI